MMGGMFQDAREAPPEPTPKLQAIEHVRIEALEDRLEAAAKFYGELLRLPRLEDIAPPVFAAFGPRRLRLELLAAETPRIDRHRRRCVLEVASLDECEKRLVAAGCRVWRTRGLGLTERRLFVYDPADCLVELKQGWTIY
jgi:hypothetical protein